ncbi:hypothetical protein [Brevundimonas sp.]|uniref:hypothetical protein n=1 Tax=Brevundimonas sp. TaxID=1871086 RepID=UPI003B00AFB6
MDSTSDVGPGLRRADVERIAREVNLSDAPTDEASLLLVTVLSFGCRLWLELELGHEPAAPLSEQGTADFAAELMENMAAKVPFVTGFPELKGFAEAFGGLSMVCRQLSNEAHHDIVGTEALFAGILLGRLGVLDVGDEQLNEAFLALAKAKHAAETRQQSLIKNRTDKEDALLAFAKPLVEADPTVTDMEIQRRFRRTQNPREKSTTSNNEAKMLARFRSDGRLPPRKRKTS